MINVCVKHDHGYPEDGKCSMCEAAEKDAEDKAAAEKDAEDKAAAEKDAKDKAAAEKDAEDKE